MFDMAEPVLMMSETANPEVIDVSPDCREQICCDSLLPALAQERVWLAGYSCLRSHYRIERRLADVHCFLLTLSGEGAVLIGDHLERLKIGEWALIPAGEPLCYRLPETQLPEMQLPETGLAETQLPAPEQQQPTAKGDWDLVWLLLHKDSPWDAFASRPRLGCTSQQGTLLRTLENLYAEQERHQDPLLSALLVEQLGFYLRRLLQKGEGQSRGERLALRLELMLKESLTECWDRTDGRRPAPIGAPAPSPLSAALRAGPHGAAATAAPAAGGAPAGEPGRLGEAAGRPVRFQERIPLLHRLQAPARAGPEPLSQVASPRLQGALRAPKKKRGPRCPPGPASRWRA